ncbi:MAG: hypothetical protein COS99_05720 [Candidatus Omnitrophica bacterium CG07_land_8_20_14_0_80_42_15]|uniref:Prenyltransferase n=1 Tax=Candidatus Aquitaenariimonas noxiae TaxID=1974741 RepID=A0A2J0KS46_9BACT|nr:MAG: hypothetical protein COS99_05720 [Candidatus Omnitrophica bacterium CG07_land_8_20_14_0_80_42_15]
MARQTKFCVKDLARALRLPFAAATALPFIFGSLIDKQHFDLIKFILGITVALSMHLSANLINDYADSKSLADWQDLGFYKFFGGSKLIQEGVLSEVFYLWLGAFFALISAVSAVALALISNSLLIIGIFLFIFFLSWSYSLKPLQLSYHRMGEIVVFILFGPVLVMGGYFIQTGIFPDLKSFILSLPFGFFTTAILYGNEIPDFENDKKSGKLTWVGILGNDRAYIIYLALVCFAFLSILFSVTSGYISPLALFTFVLVPVAVRSAGIFKKYPKEKIKLVESAKLTIAMHVFASVILIIVVIL